MKEFLLPLLAILVVSFTYITQSSPNSSSLGSIANIDEANVDEATPAADPPIQFRLAFAGATGMSVMWTTLAEKPGQSCKYGLSAANLDSSVNTEFSRSYGTDWFHSAVLIDLKPSTTYYYQCGTFESSDVSPVLSFESQQVVGEDKGFTIAVVGDMGYVNAESTIKNLNENLDSYDWTLHIGDFAYSDDFYLKATTYEKSWTTWLNAMENVTGSKAYMGLPGNHEASCEEVTPSFCREMHKNFTAYRYRFRFPNQESGGAENMFYSFDYGFVHFVQISTETDFPHAPEGEQSRFRGGPFGDQLTWLADDLKKAAANRANVPWIIVSGHRPVYYSGGVDASVQKAFLPLLEQFDVDIYFSGHEHLYERYWPISDGHATQKDYIQPKDVIYIVNGAAGNVEGHSSAGANPDYLAYRTTQDYGYGTLEFSNTTHLTWSFFGADNNLLDQAQIVKTH